MPGLTYGPDLTIPRIDLDLAEPPMLHPAFPPVAKLLRSAAGGFAASHWLECWPSKPPETRPDPLSAPATALPRPRETRHLPLHDRRRLPC